MLRLRPAVATDRALARSSGMARNLNFAPDTGKPSRATGEWSAELHRDHLTIALGQLYRVNTERVPEDMLALLRKLR